MTSATPATGRCATAVAPPKARERIRITDYLDGCRQKRSIIEYDRAGDATETDTAELIAYVRELQTQVLAWLQDKHPELTPPP